MSENLLFEYAVIRVVPRVEREEFLNVGVVLLCASQKFLRMKYSLDEQRLLSVCNSIDVDDLKRNITSFELICEGGKVGGAIGQLSIAERFRWLTSTRSTIVQTSKVHPGLCSNPLEVLDRLFDEFVL